MNSKSHTNGEFESIAADLWKNNALWWQNGFTEGADPEYEEQIIPLLLESLSGARRVLDVGTGEGQLLRRAVGESTRELSVGIDPTWEQISEAARRSRGGCSFLRADALRIPFRDASFDSVVACLVFEHIVDFEGAISEISRVLEPGGKFLLFLNHPLMQTPGSGWIDDHVIGEQYWRIGNYLAQDRTVEEVEKDVFIPFVHRPLSMYLNALAHQSLTLVNMDEPPPPPGFLDKAPEYHEAAFIPRLLFLTLVKK